MKMLNNRGLTAVEMVIGVGLVAMLTTIVVTTQLMVTKEQVELTQDLEDSIDTKLAERVLFSDFNNVDPSYNNLKVIDDNGMKFFDYYPDMPGNAVKSRLDRNVTLSLKGRKEFVILVQDNTAGPMLVYDPVLAYHVGAAPDDFNVAASLEFKGLNYNNSVTSQRPAMWNAGRLVMLDTPARLRPVDANGNIDMQVAPRSPVYVGQVAGISTVADSNITSYVDTSHPETRSLISTADVFLRRAPSIGGGQALVRLRAVRLIKYYLVEAPTANGPALANLFKVSYQDGRWGEPSLMADRVQEVTLRRDSVLKRMIYFKVKKVDRDETKTAGL